MYPQLPMINTEKNKSNGLHTNNNKLKADIDAIVNPVMFLKDKGQTDPDRIAEVIIIF